MGLGDTNADEQAKRRRRGQSFANILEPAAQTPKVFEVFRARAGFRADNDAEQDQCNQRASLSGCKNILDPLSEIQPARVHEGEQRDHCQPERLGSGERKGVTAEPNRRDEIIRLGDPRNQHTGVPREADRHRRDGARLDDQQKRPAVKKTPKRRERLSQINVLPTGFRHHRRQFSIRQCCGQGQQTGDDPNHKQPTG